VVTVLVAAFLRLYELDLLPPGLFYDEAYNGLDVRGVLSGAQLPLYFPGNYGREPLFLYLQSAFVALLGYTPYALRVTAAFIGILTVPAIYWLTHTLLRGEGRGFDVSAVERATPTSQFTIHHSQFTIPTLSPVTSHLSPFWLATLAAAGFAVSYWHVSVSRLGFRAILLPLLSSLLIGCFWRAWTGRRRRDFIWAGVWLGAVFYTYTAARVLPLVILAFVLLEAVIHLFQRAGHREHRESTEHTEQTEITPSHPLTPSPAHPLARGLLLTDGHRPPRRRAAAAHLCP
jgi:predicted membrane-bound mannosyltransferase